jgi:hypothetical protein
VAVIVVVGHAVPAFALGMRGEGVVTHRTTDDPFVLDVEDQKASATPEMLGDRYTVFRSYCDLHSLVSLLTG